MWRVYYKGKFFSKDWMKANGLDVEDDEKNTENALPTEKAMIQKSEKKGKNDLSISKQSSSKSKGGIDEKEIRLDIVDDEDENIDNSDMNDQQEESEEEEEDDNEEIKQESDEDEEISQTQPQNKSGVSASAQTSLQKVPEKDRNQASMRLKQKQE